MRFSVLLALAVGVPVEALFECDGTSFLLSRTCSEDAAVLNRVVAATQVCSLTSWGS